MTDFKLCCSRRLLVQALSSCQLAMSSPIQMLDLQRPLHLQAQQGDPVLLLLLGKYSASICWLLLANQTILHILDSMYEDAQVTTAHHAQLLAPDSRRQTVACASGWLCLLARLLLCGWRLCCITKHATHAPAQSQKLVLHKALQQLETPAQSGTGVACIEI